MEGERLGGLGEQRHDRGDAQQGRALVERRLVQDVLVAVVEPGGLRQQAHERDEGQDPRREVGRGEERDDDERAAEGEHVRGQQREAPERVAAADARGRPDLVEERARGRQGDRVEAGVLHRAPVLAPTCRLVRRCACGSPRTAPPSRGTPSSTGHRREDPAAVPDEPREPVPDVGLRALAVVLGGPGEPVGVRQVQRPALARERPVRGPQTGDLALLRRLEPEQAPLGDLAPGRRPRQLR